MTDLDTNRATRNKTDDITLKELLILIRSCLMFLISRKMFVIILVLLGCISGILYSKLRKTSFTSTTTFVLEEEKAGGIGSIAGLASIAGVDLGNGGGGLFQGDNILELYKSRYVIEKTLLTSINYKGKSQLLIDNYLEFTRIRESWTKDEKLKNIKFAGSERSVDRRLKDSIIGVVVAEISKNNLKVSKPDKKLSIIRVDVSAENEFFSKNFNDFIVKNVNEFYIQTKTVKSLRNVQILQQKTDSVRAVMNGAIYAAASISDATPNLNLTRQAQRIAPVQRSQFSAETNKAVLSELVKNLEMSKMALLRETPLIQVIDHPIYPLKADTFSTLKGFVVGGILFGFLSIFILVIKFLYLRILQRDAS